MAEHPTPVSITCPTCGHAFPVPAEVLGIEGHQVIVRMDRSGLYGHMTACAGDAGERAGREHAEQSAQQQAEGQQPGKTLERHNPASGPVVAPAFVAKGKRTCLMCGAAAPECLDRVRRSRKGCCPACESGNTHPSPQDTVPCSTWAADRG